MINFTLIRLNLIAIDALFNFGRCRSTWAHVADAALRQGNDAAWSTGVTINLAFITRFENIHVVPAASQNIYWTGKTSSSRESTTCFFDNSRSSSLQASHCRHNTKRGWKVILPFQALVYFIYFVLDKCWRIYFNSHMQLSYIQPVSRPIRGTI